MSGLAGLIQAGLDGTQSEADRRWSEADIDPLRMLGSELDTLLDPDDTVQLDTLNNRIEALNNDPDIGNPLELEQHIIRFGTEATHFAIRGEQFNANLNVVLTAIDNGEAPFSALFENLGGYVSAFELVTPPAAVVARPRSVSGLRTATGTWPTPSVWCLT